MSFTGPLFIVGMPRSGTKLLRDLMNRHPLISIPDVESHFIPYLVSMFGETLSITTRQQQEDFFRAFSSTTFYFNNIKKGRMLTMDEFIAQCDFTDWNSVFRFIALYFSKKNYDSPVIWGDKTPGYLAHSPMLKKIFPAARFVHIIRDPRDYCLSERSIWNKNIYRSAIKWKKIMGQARKFPALFGNDYLEVHYESLTENPEQTLSVICRFLGIDFVPEMLTISQSTEFYGKGRGSKEVIKNSKKYLGELTDREVSKVESLIHPVMGYFGYELLHAVNPRELSRPEALFYRLSDAWNMYRFHVREKGLIKGTSYTFKLRNNNIEPPAQN